MSTLDAVTTTAVRSDAIHRAVGLASPAWRAAALAGIKALCATHEEITSDDLWELLGEPFMNQVNPSALGPVFVKAKVEGLIVSTGRYKDSERPITHGKQNRVWTVVR